VVEVNVMRDMGEAQMVWEGAIPIPHHGRRRKRRRWNGGGYRGSEFVSVLAL